MERSLVLLGWENFLCDTGLHYPLRIPKLSPSFLFLSLYPKFQSPIFGVLAVSLYEGTHGAESPVVMLCYSQAALPSITAPAQQPWAVGNAKLVVTQSLGMRVLPLGLAASGTMWLGRGEGPGGVEWWFPVLQ